MNECTNTWSWAGWNAVVSSQQGNELWPFLGIFYTLEWIQIATNGQAGYNVGVLNPKSRERPAELVEFNFMNGDK